MTPPLYSFAFQPIVDIETWTPVAYEALVRGFGGEEAAHVLDGVGPANIQAFDVHGRRRAMSLALALGLDCNLNLNLVAGCLEAADNAVAATLTAADAVGLAHHRIVLEVSECTAVHDRRRFATLIDSYRDLGLKFAIDDFGSGYSGLNLLADFQPNQVKLDMHLVRSIESHAPRQAIIRAVVSLCQDLNIELIAEGVESMGEYRWLADQGIRLYQGFLFGKPMFESLPEIVVPARSQLSLLSGRPRLND
ncbi:EAL domain-containing protein [soil metagenome]